MTSRASVALMIIPPYLLEFVSVRQDQRVVLVKKDWQSEYKPLMILHNVEHKLRVYYRSCLTLERISN